MATKKDSIEKAGLNPSELEGFTGETLDQMALENVEGGNAAAVDVNFSKCGPQTYTGNCVAGCACGSN